MSRWKLAVAGVAEVRSGEYMVFLWSDSLQPHAVVWQVGQDATPWSGDTPLSGN